MLPVYVNNVCLTSDGIFVFINLLCDKRFGTKFYEIKSKLQLLKVFSKKIQEFQSNKMKYEFIKYISSLLRSWMHDGI